MTVELVLLMSLYAFIVMGVFLGDVGPIETFKRSAPRLGARVERNVSTGWGFRKATDGDKVNWVKPGGGGP
ncbi:MAG: hypothetical protein H6624_13480 [Bdellovibrionaceae bacterium]|nr:hypothetical protein [Bdellovibrionales bacterium]MCB9085354.1 hypothetical protein [Pseudobdellovibrionaceae bacterium]